MLLATILCDWVEGAKLALVRCLPANFPCHACECPREEFHSYASGSSARLRSTLFPLIAPFSSLTDFLLLLLPFFSSLHRSETRSNKKFEQATIIAQKSVSRANVYLSQYSLVLLENCLWNVPGFDVHTCIGPDCLHELDLGLSNWIILFLFAQIDQRYGSGKSSGTLLEILSV